MIGNDIIDLKLASRQSNWRRKGFLEKVFSVSERKMLSSPEGKEIKVWLLWSMKEAAYKAHQRKMSLPRRMNWKIQECLSLKCNGKNATGIVKIGEEKYFTSSVLTSDLIHTIAVDHIKSLYKESLRQQPLFQSKQHFIKEISKVIGLPINSLELKKNDAGIPFLFSNDQLFPLAFSFSDHGRFSGFCVSLRDS